MITRYVRFLYRETVSYGILDGDAIQILEGDRPENFRPSGRTVLAERVTRLTPPCTPEKIVGLGLNYYDTFLEDGAAFPRVPKIFLKAPTAIVGAGEPILKTPMVQDLACEAELGVVIAKRARFVPREEAMDYVWGYLAVNDVTAKDLQKADGLWTRGKSCDSFLPLSDTIVAGVDPFHLQITCEINGRRVQNGNTEHMIFDLPQTISFISHVMTLSPGDIILTGTPGGYGKTIRDGDRVTVRVDSVGEVENPVREFSEGWRLDLNNCE